MSFNYMPEVFINKAWLDCPQRKMGHYPFSVIKIKPTEQKALILVKRQRGTSCLFSPAGIMQCLTVILM